MRLQQLKHAGHTVFVTRDISPMKKDHATHQSSAQHGLSILDLIDRITMLVTIQQFPHLLDKEELPVDEHWHCR